MLISGIQKMTLLDFPGRVSCIVFTAGCNFRCGYCHNPEFVLPEELVKLQGSFISESAVFNFLDQRQGLLDGVVVSGGEPTIMPDLPEFLEKIKAKGFLVKLDTNGNNPAMLKKLVEARIVDYVALDAKTGLSQYKSLAGDRANHALVDESAQFLKNGVVPYEFRTTLVKELHTPEVLAELKKLVSGADSLFLQQFRSARTLDPLFENYTSFTLDEMKEIARDFSSVVKTVGIR